MKKIFVIFVILVFICPGVEAGLFKSGVDFEDLSSLSLQALETLKDAEFSVFLTQVKLGGAKKSEKQAKEHLKAANLVYDSKQIMLKSARKDLKEAQTASDQGKIASMEKTLRGVQEEFDKATALVIWREKEVDAREAGVKRAKVELALAEAERDFARISKMIKEKVSAAGKYKLEDFKKNVLKRKKEHAAAVETEKQTVQEADRHRQKYEKALKKTE